MEPILYDRKKIGERIKNERKEKGFSQKSFGEKLTEIYSERTVRKWEKGDEIPPLEVMLNMCNIFNCELGYLLCEYDCKTRKATEIHEETGLSEQAINNLYKITFSLKNTDSNNVFSRTINAINQLLGTYNGLNLLSFLGEYFYNTHIDGYEEYSDGSRRILHAEDLNNADLYVKIMPLIKEFQIQISDKIQQK